MSRKQIKNAMEAQERIDMFRKRIELCLALFSALMILLVLRLYYVQISCHESFAGAVRSQYEIPVSGFDAEYNFYYIIEKSKEDGRLRTLLDDAGAKDITKESSRYSVYEMKTHNPTLNEKLREDYGAYAFRNYALHTRSNGGNRKKQFSVIIYGDAAGKIIPGLSPEIRELP